MTRKTILDSEGGAAASVSGPATGVSRPSESGFPPERISGIERLSPRLPPPLEGLPEESAVSEPGAPTSRGEALGRRGAGKTIGQYEIIRQIGAGGMGTVYLARDSKLGRRVAIKVLQARDPELTRRFIIEARATARCTHENIVVIHEVGEYRGDPFMVLEYIEGSSLANLRGPEPMAVSRAVEIMVPVVRALVRAHEEGIVHRDLKPDNILISRSGSVKVLDFGIAKLLQGDPRAAGLTQREHRVSSLNLAQPDSSEWAPLSGISGTIPYMSPEQWGVGGEIDNRTDIWAVGVTLFELLAGVHPLGENMAQVVKLDAPMPRMARAAPWVPVELAAVVDRCLRKRKEERFASALDLLKALEPFEPGRLQASPVRLDGGPYAGLRAFQEEDSGRFFGRSQELTALKARIRDVALLAVIGPSGVGKSSLLRAGLVPALRASEENWEVMIFRPGRYPVQALANLCAPLLGLNTSNNPEMAAEAALRERFVGEPGYLGTVLRNRCHERGARLLVMVDQFEELYTLGAPQLERRAFTGSLAGAADDPTSPVRVVVSLRSDFLGRFAEDPHFMEELAKGLYFLGPPGQAGLRDALVQPAEMVGYRFESQEVVDEMVHFLEATPNGLPLLQFAAAQLWETRDPLRHLLTEQSYRGMGGVAGSLVTHADRVYAQLEPALQGLCRNLMVHLVTPERTRAVRTLEELRQLSGEHVSLEKLVDKLVDCRLLIVQTTKGAATVELVHESLVVNWPTMRRWLDETQEDSTFLEQLFAAARQWDLNRHAQGLLWRGELVDELERFRRRYAGNLPRVARSFADAVRAHALRGAQTRRALLVAAVVATVLLLAAAVVALVVINDARELADENARIAKESKGVAERRLAMQLAAEDNLMREAQKTLEALKTSKALERQLQTKKVELEQKNTRLVGALVNEKEAKATAERATATAERDKAAALEAKREATELAVELEAQRDAERARADRLTEQIGRLIERLE